MLHVWFMLITFVCLAIAAILLTAVAALIVLSVLQCLALLIPCLIMKAGRFLLLDSMWIILSIVAALLWLHGLVLFAIPGAVVAFVVLLYADAELNGFIHRSVPRVKQFVREVARTQEF